MKTIDASTVCLGWLGCALALIPSNSRAGISHASVRSPDGRLEIRCWVQDAGRVRGQLFYDLRYDGRPVLEPSRLGFRLGGAAELQDGISITGTKTQRHDTDWVPVYGERSRIPDHYRQLQVALRTSDAKLPRAELMLRAYDEGAAFRFHFPKQRTSDTLTITAESDRFQFPAGCQAYAEYGTEGKYRRVPLRSVRPHCEIPLTVVYPNSMFASVLEADVGDYSSMLIGPVAGDGNALVSELRGSVTRKLPFSTPWRVILVGTRPGDLLEHDYLILNLNPPNALANASWIRPGKVIREVTLSTAGGKACIDFARRHGLQYVEFDAGWYGPENSDHSDATTVTPDRKRVGQRADYPGLDLPTVVSYARRNGVGVLLYVNRRALERQLDAILPLYEKWGVAGIKFGFVRTGSQPAMAWLARAVRQAAAHHLVVDIHDGYRPTGLSRTYPNLLTQEGVRGNEHMPTAQHNVTLPFTRFLAGAADYAICYYNRRIQTTHAHQLALGVVFYSPLQFVFWYDRPSDYHGEREVAFFKSLPTTWDDTKVMAGRIGEFIVVARRKGEDWFVGCLTNDRARELTVPLTFLPARRTYRARLYTDAPSGDTTRTHVRIRKATVTSSDTLRVHLAASGGAAIHFQPEQRTDRP